jgi:amino acid transporter
MVFAYAGIFMGGATLRDREKYNKLKDDRRKVMILSATLTVASIPLFVIGGRYRHQYKKGLDVTFHLEPVDGYKGEQLQVAAVGIRMGL